jgi:hypothetical protein
MSATSFLLLTIFCTVDFIAYSFTVAGLFTGIQGPVGWTGSGGVVLQAANAADSAIPKISFFMFVSLSLF